MTCFTWEYIDMSKREGDEIFMIQRVDYDQENDIVYIAFSDQHNSYGDEIDDYIILRRNWDDDRITGVTILNFTRWVKKITSR